MTGKNLSISKVKHSISLIDKEQKKKDNKKAREKDKEVEAKGKVVFDRIISNPGLFSSITLVDIEQLRRYKRHKWTKAAKRVQEKIEELASEFPHDFQMSTSSQLVPNQPI